MASAESWSRFGVTIIVRLCRNSATELVKQELLFVGQESGKLIAIRDIIHKVCVHGTYAWSPYRN